MNIPQVIDSLAFVQNAAEPNYLTFPYTNAIGKTHEQLAVSVPIHGTTPSERDKAALAEAVTVQGALGEWTVKEDGSVWLMPKA